MVERASALAVEAGDVPARNLADSYRAFHLAMVRRYDEAVAQAEDVIGRAPLLTDHGYNTLVSIVALTACCAVHDPARVRGWVDHMLTRLSPAVPAWGVQVLAAAVHASGGEAAAAAELAATVRALVLGQAEDPSGHRDRLMTMLGAGLHLRCSCAGGAGRRTSRDTGPWRRLGDCLSWCA